MAERTELHRVIYEKDGDIATITLNYPEKLNAIDFPGDGGICDSFYRDALGLAEEDDEVKVVLIKAAGRAFCAGHDLSRVGFIYGMQPGQKAGQQVRLKVDNAWMDKTYRRLFLFPKITVAVVHGLALEGGRAPRSDWPGGVRLADGTVRYCWITNCVAGWDGGGGASVYGGVLHDCTIRRNNATDDAGDVWRRQRRWLWWRM